MVNLGIHYPGKKWGRLTLRHCIIPESEFTVQAFFPSKDLTNLSLGPYNIPVDFLAKENFPLFSIERLREAGHNGARVIEETPEAKDLDILK